MKIRTALFAAVLVSAALGVPAAQAAKAPKPVCNLLVDDKGDALPATSTSLDILSADLASDSRKITGVIRLGGDPKALDPTAPTGRTYQLQFKGQGGEHHVFMSYLVTPTASSATYGFYNPTTRINEGIAEATLKVVGNNVYMTAPVGAFGSYGKFKPGAKITELAVHAGRMVGAYVDSGTYAYNSPEADGATGGKVYTAGARSCVKVGG